MKIPLGNKNEKFSKKKANKLNGEIERSKMKKIKRTTNKLIDYRRER